VAIDTEALKPNVHLGSKCSAIFGKEMPLTWDVSEARVDEKSAAAIVPLERGKFLPQVLLYEKSWIKIGWIFASNGL
jgi:hypothetical protein